MYQSTCKEQAKVCAIAGIEQPNTDVIDECAVSMYQKPTSIDLLECPKHSLMTVARKNQRAFFAQHQV